MSEPESGLSAAINRTARWLLSALVRVDLAWARALGDEAAVVDALLEVGRLTGENGRLDEAERCFTEAGSRARGLGLELALARSEVQLGSIFILRGNFEEARMAIEPALPILSTQAERPVFTDALLRLALVNDELGQVDAAAAYLEQACSAAQANGDTRRGLQALMDLGGIAYRQKEYETADGYWLEALALSRQRKDAAAIAKATFFSGVVSRHMGRVDQARSLLAESETLYARLGRSAQAVRAREYLAALESDAASDMSPLDS